MVGDGEGGEAVRGECCLEGGAVTVVYAEHMNVRDERGVWLRGWHDGCDCGRSDWVNAPGWVWFNLFGWLASVGVGVGDGVVLT